MKKPAHNNGSPRKAIKTKQTHPVFERNPGLYLPSPTSSYWCQPPYSSGSFFWGKKDFLKSRKLNQHENLKAAHNFPPQWPKARAVSSSARDGSFPPPSCQLSSLMLVSQHREAGPVWCDCSRRCHVHWEGPGEHRPSSGVRGSSASGCVGGSGRVWPSLSWLLQSSFLLSPALSLALCWFLLRTS